MSGTLLAVASLLGVATLGWMRARRAMAQLYPPPFAHGPHPIDDIDHDPDRPTVMVLLDHAGTEVSDFLIPYELLAATGECNVHAVAPQPRPAILTGGLDVMPHLCFDTAAELPSGAPDLVVVPAMRDPDPQLIGWIGEQARAGARVLSICSGAEVAARAGVFDERRATTFWADIDRLERAHPRVRWVRGVRYVQDGPVAASAGITSGIDATLALLEQLVGLDAMHRAAATIGYVDLRYLDDPTVTQHRIRPSDLIFPLTAAFARRSELGVVLTDGIDETRLAAVLDTFAATLATRTRTVSIAAPTVTSRHGLTLLPRTGLDQREPDTPLVMPGEVTLADGRPSEQGWQPPAGDPPYALLRQAVQRLAASHGRPLGRFAAKRLELRDPIDLDDAPGWPATLTRLAVGPILGRNGRLA